jgi:rubrerythrin
MFMEKSAGVMDNDIFQKAKIILDEMEEVEFAAADLYRRFAGSFPADRIFWQGLAADEDGHAAMVSDLRASLFRNGSPFEVVRLNAAVLATFRQGIEQHALRLQRGEISRRGALFIARDLEKTMIESGFYRAVRSEKPEFRMVQEKIRRETEGHFEKLQNYILTLFP